jgi:hypothetical protein
LVAFPARHEAPVLVLEPGEVNKIVIKQASIAATTLVIIAGFVVSSLQIFIWRRKLGRPANGA